MCCACQMAPVMNIFDSFEGTQLVWPYCWKHFLQEWTKDKRHGVTTRCARIKAADTKPPTSSIAVSTH